MQAVQIGNVKYQKPDKKDSRKRDKMLAPRTRAWQLLVADEKRQVKRTVKDGNIPEH
jgi:hypothetical protein